MKKFFNVLFLLGISFSLNSYSLCSRDNKICKNCVGFTEVESESEELLLEEDRAN